ncbi:hypothetical protein DSO57_1033686 [Entomophthora muscae]|uniref:Uncharacterized protein n=1 Tax=Entomophthora muscae TaxID=34485 RepID=A0ACC2U9S9_9FUNG|nr:hypothetical protein DSO57_1033686 [Entomophthora muscae]
MPNPVEFLHNAKNKNYPIIPEATCKTFKRLMDEILDYKKAAAIVRILDKAAHKLRKNYLKTGYVEQLGLLLVSSKLQIDVSLANVLYLILCKSTADYNRIEL